LGLGFGIQGSGFRFMVQYVGLRVLGFDFRIKGLGFRVQGLGFRISGFLQGFSIGFRVKRYS
jgi:hypothetical protein